MGVSDAINSLRSEAVAKSTLYNVISDHVAQSSTDAQKQSAGLKAAFSTAQNGFSQMLSGADQSRGSLRSSLRSLQQSALNMIFTTILGMTGGIGALINAGCDITMIGIDIKVMAEDCRIRNRRLQTAEGMAPYVQMYSPALPELVRKAT